MNNLIIVAAGGGIGAALRHLCQLGSYRLFGANFPYGTLVVNLVGCLFMGLCYELLTRRLSVSPQLQMFITTGILGGFTTFSAFSLDFFVLFQRGQIASAFGYAAVSVVFSILAVFIGIWVARYFS